MENTEKAAYTIDGKVLLRDNCNLSDDQYKTAVSICNRIREIDAFRLQYIASQGLDKEIFMPSSNWADDCHHFQIYRVVSSGNFDVLNRLRWYTQCFSGYHLPTFSTGAGKVMLHPIPADYDTILDSLITFQDDSVFRFAKLAAMLPQRYVIPFPAVCGEVGIRINGFPVNHDTVTYQGRINLLHGGGVLSNLESKLEANRRIRILEIGGGYGGLAYLVKKILPQSQYVICDLPESLLFSSLYLPITVPNTSHLFYHGGSPLNLTGADQGFVYCPNHYFEEFCKTGISFDLVINTLSLAEMSEAQVHYYSAQVKKLIGAHGIFFEHNQNNEPVGLLDCKKIVAQYFQKREDLFPLEMESIGNGLATLWSNPG